MPTDEKVWRWEGVISILQVKKLQVRRCKKFAGCWHQISGAGHFPEWHHSVWQLSPRGTKYQGWVFAHLLGCTEQLHSCQYGHWRGGGLDQGQVLGNKRRVQEPCSATQSEQDGERLCRHRMGCGLRWRCSLTQCHFLCRHDRLSCFAGANQSRIPKWGTWGKFPSAHPTGAECPKRRGLCKGDGGPHSSTADLHDYGTLGYAWSGWGSYHYGLLEIWGLLQWTRCSGPTGAAAPIERWGSATNSWLFCLLAKPADLLFESEWSISASGPGWGLHYRWR